MAERYSRDMIPTRYLILVNDLCFTKKNVPYRPKKFESHIQEYLKGTILQEVFFASMPTTNTTRITCIVLDTREIIECDENDVDALTEEIMGLLMAISSCKERYDVFRNKERLADGLDMEAGAEVVVRLPAMSGEVLGRLRYKGKVHHKVGTYFGVELINAKGKGNTNGTIRKHHYFSCPEDCGIFLGLNRVSSRDYDQLRTPIPAPRRHPRSQRSMISNSYSDLSATRDYSSPPSGSSQVSVCEPVIGVSEAELSTLNIHIDMKVYIFTEVNGHESQELGSVKFIGRLPNELPTNDIYVGIELVNPSGNGRGVFNRRQLFKTKLNHAALVPLSGVLPASTIDHTPPLAPNRHLDESLTYIDKRYKPETRNQQPPSSYSGPAANLRSSTTKNRKVVSQPVLNSEQRGFPDGYDELSSQLDIYGVEKQVKPRREVHTLPLPKNSKQNNHRQMNDYSRRPFQSEPISVPVQEQAFQYLSQLHPPADEIPISGFEHGTMVQVLDGIDNLTLLVPDLPLYGVVKWTGYLPRDEDLSVGLELDNPVPTLTDGTYNGVRIFETQPGHALFVRPEDCAVDPRFYSDAKQSHSNMQSVASRNFGDFKAPCIPGTVAPPKTLQANMVGKGKGIQGHQNSCYLDSTLFSMFAYSYCLDTILFRSKRPGDLPQYEQVQKVLKENIVNPLRKTNFVRADMIMKLRELLDELGSVSGLTNEEKDPEEFLQTLLNHVFKAEPLFELRQGNDDHIQECYFYQIFLDKDEKMVLPSTQLLIEQSFLACDLKFREVPVCLILQMPRFGKDYKMYNRVRPSLTLDITDMLEKIPRSCTVCGGLAEFECKQCSVERSMQEHISSYCVQCAKRCHQHPLRRQHNYQKIEVCDEYKSFISQEGEAPVERQILDLYAVVCIETSHYVSFAKCGSGRNAKWCFFDSMADRVGEQSGYNIPEITYCENFEKWLETDQHKLLEMEQKEMPEHMRRLLCDAYMCLYQSSEMKRFG
nr:ubiquitin carboxyl-terminal hydrolase CYLD [Ciona intestinalis]|eukprot:XP_009860718.1 ubiquitin carboxyl-terminal hydrolase CYLD [Ciona intestinalis]